MGKWKRLMHAASVEKAQLTRNAVEHTAKANLRKEDLKMLLITQSPQPVPTPSPTPNILSSIPSQAFDVLMRTVNGRGTSATTTTSSADKDDDAYDDDGEWTSSTAAMQLSTTTTTTTRSTNPLLRGHAEDHSNTMHTDAKKT